MTNRPDTDAPAGRARTYQDARPPYPSLVADFVRRRVGRVRTAADVGCGTGLSTTVVRLMADEVVGVEPDHAMLSVARGHHGSAIRLQLGSAERTGLPDSSVDLIVAASSAEWFDQVAAQKEFGRVLRANGSVLLIWHHRIVLDAESRGFDMLWTQLAGPRLGPYPEDIDGIVVPAFLQGRVHRWERSDWHLFDADRLISFARSSVYFQRGQTRSGADAHLRDFVEGAGGQIRLPFRTVAYLGRL
ncbi:class I SAM-dependent methyltransferase [Promicromonospora vindobonensis]|uniref:Class I SAM-dependent methyltransferase n=1 Tax=Promicromonospora vindobonensis TaxID=195748 RepID=A0ABW5W0Q3_9MICO